MEAFINYLNLYCGEVQWPLTIESLIKSFFVDRKRTKIWKIIFQNCLFYKKPSQNLKFTFRLIFFSLNDNSPRRLRKSLLISVPKMKSKQTQTTWRQETTQSKIPTMTLLKKERSELVYLENGLVPVLFETNAFFGVTCHHSDVCTASLNDESRKIVSQITRF